tara:strand:+ start:8053 stop:8583 length:531 start_codon:yes stop_codon:yes gene_type:complete
MARFKLEEYETVEERLHRFWEKYPKGRVQTDLVAKSDDFTQVIFKASVWRVREFDKTPPCATGYAEEHRSSGRGPNADCWVENGETSAIGRALANLGMSGKRRPSREEMSKVASHESRQSEKEVAWYAIGRLAKTKQGFTRMGEFFERKVASIHDVSLADLEKYLEHLKQCEDKSE